VLWQVCAVHRRHVLSPRWVCCSLCDGGVRGIVFVTCLGRWGLLMSTVWCYVGTPSEVASNGAPLELVQVKVGQFVRSCLCDLQRCLLVGGVPLCVEK
jgi:hypothetical protein